MNQEHSKFYLLQFKELILSCVFIFCLEVTAVYDELASCPTHSVATSAQYSVRSSVWMLSVEQGMGYRGTGFFIAPNKLITNFHNISHIFSVEDIVLSQESHLRRLNIKGILAVSARYDLALLETVESVNDYLTIREKPLREQEDLFVTGYPGGQIKDIKNISDIILSEDRISFFVNHVSNGGMSGSPVVDTNKQVVGVLYQAYSNFTSAVHLDHLRAFIHQALKNTPRKDLFSEALENLKNMATKGDMLAQYELGSDYYRIHKNIFRVSQWNSRRSDRSVALKRAIEYLERAAEQGYTPAQYMLGAIIRYYRVGQNYEEKSIEYLERVAEQGYAPAQYMLGNIYNGLYSYGGHAEGRRSQESWLQENYERTIEYLVRAAEQGYAPAQFKLFDMFKIGHDMVVDTYKDKVECFERVADMGLSRVYFALGMIHLRGRKEGVFYEGQNYEKAIEYLERAAEQGYAPAQFNLSIMYSSEARVPKVLRNREKSKEYLKQAAKQGHALARRHLQWEFEREASQ